MLGRRGGREALVGTVVAAALVILVGGILIIGEQTQLFRPKVGFRTVFPDASGLGVGSPVTMAGIQIGVVDSIRRRLPFLDDDDGLVVREPAAVVDDVPVLVQALSLVDEEILHRDHFTLHADDLGDRHDPTATVRETPDLDDHLDGARHLLAHGLFRQAQAGRVKTLGNRRGNDVQLGRIVLQQIVLLCIPLALGGRHLRCDSFVVDKHDIHFRYQDGIEIQQ